MPSALANVKGHTEPRIFTPPLRPLTPETSYGFSVNRFADGVLHHPFDPWQQWTAIHAGELLEDGRPRFRIVLILVARQNGKTEIPVVLSLYWQFVECVPLILGTSTKLEYAKESWAKAVKLAEKVQARAITHGDDEAIDFAASIPRKGWKRETNGEQESKALVEVADGDWQESRYKIAPANEEGGRSLTIHRLVCDELRQHKNYSAWGAAEPATNAVWDAQIWAMSNAGDATSVVLNDLREQALHYIQTGEGDPRIGLFEWSAPDDARPDDIEGLRHANPNLGYRKDPDVLLRKGQNAMRKGGDVLAMFETEDMCRTVRNLAPAINATAWSSGWVEGDLSAYRDRVALFLDVSMDGLHATLAAAAQLPDGKVRGEIVAAWEGAEATRKMRGDLPGIVVKVAPRALGWLPSGPAAAQASALKARPGESWPPAGVVLAPVTSEAPAVCMGLADLVNGGQLLHATDPLLDDHAAGAEKLTTGDRWVFSRRGGGHVDGLYALAGAVHLARSLPAPVDLGRGMVLPDDD